MPRDLFAGPAVDRRHRNTRLLPLSIAVHGAIVCAVVITPLLAVGDLPDVPAQRMVALIVQPAPLPAVVRVAPSSTPKPVVAPSVTPTPPTGSLSPSPSFQENVVRSGAWDGLVLPSAGVETFAGTGGPRPAGAPGPAAASKAPTSILQVGGEVQRPRKLTHVAPEYPAIARDSRIEGDVLIDAVIGPDGRVRQATVRESSSRLLEQPALVAVRQWVYTPTRLNGVPVAVIMTVEVRFRLSR